MRGCVLLLAAAATASTACEGRTDLQGNVPRWVLVEELRIGQADGAEALGEIISLAVNSSGEMLIAEWREGSVRVIDGRGRTKRRIGRSGGGPGEFSQPGAITWSGDTAVISDPMMRRLHLFGPDGEFARTIAPRSAPLMEQVGPQSVTRRFSDGSLAGMALVPVGGMEEALSSEAVVRMSEDGSFVDTLVVLATRQRGLRLEVGGGLLVTQQPVSDAPFWMPLGDGSGIIVVDRTAFEDGAPVYRVTRIGLQGDTVFSRAIPYRAIALGPSLVDSIVERIAERLSGNGHHPIGELRAAIREHAYLPPNLPPVTRGSSGRDGTVWLRREEMSDSVAWDVLEASGERVAQVMMPRDAVIYEASPEFVWTVEKDSLGINYIVRYGVIRD